MNNDYVKAQLWEFKDKIEKFIEENQHVSLGSVKFELKYDTNGNIFFEFIAMDEIITTLKLNMVKASTPNWSGEAIEKMNGDWKKNKLIQERITAPDIEDTCHFEERLQKLCTNLQASLITEYEKGFATAEKVCLEFINKNKPTLEEIIEYLESPRK